MNIVEVRKVASPCGTPKASCGVNVVTSNHTFFLPSVTVFRMLRITSVNDIPRDIALRYSVDLINKVKELYNKEVL